MNAVSLDARPEAVPFDGKAGYGYHPAPSMKKLI
jgi:hypothetical protein